MVSQTSPDVPHQLYAELIRSRAQERMAHRLLRKQRADRRAARRAAVPRPKTVAPVPEQVELYCSPRQA
ncbi:hypothetical protein [Microlunatus sp. GCM10028923]|uniref:hypothetical protein n=1 Tax=Microlunatus sp. GCM10028923 TaxID=3273400 RepID=UPI00361C1876